MRKRNISINKLIYNNRFVMLFSLILAITIWLVVAVQFSPQEDRTIKDVPVKIDLSQTIEAFDLQIFGASDFTVDVTVTGKRYVVTQSALTADDIVVIANTNYVDSAGKYSLKLDVKKKNQDSDYVISKVSDENIEVYFDTYNEREFALVPDIVTSGDIIPAGYYKDTEILSAKSVTISGPATETNKISKVFARVTVDKELTSTKTLQAEIVPLGEYSSILRYLTVNNGNADITLTIPVYKTAELPVSVTFKNTPAFFIDNPLKYTCSPGVALFGIDETVFESTKEVSISTIDFSSIKSGKNVISVQSNTIKQAKVLDSNEVFKVTIDAVGLSEKKSSVLQSNISAINVNSGNTAILKNGINSVTIIGQQAVINNISAGDIYAEVDFGNEVLQPGVVTKPARLYIKNYDNCWVFGQYTVDIIIS